MKLTLSNKSHLIDNIWSFVFEPEEETDYKAGEFVRVRLDHANPDDAGPKRWFTNSAPPFEEVVQIVTRVTDSTFKQALDKLDIGASDLEMIDPPDGDFTWRDGELPMLWVAGGIGVTPFHSILKQRVHEGKPIPVTLLYNGRTDALPWKEEFDAYAQDHPEFKVKYLIGDRLSVEALAETFPNINESVVYLSGPEPMVESVGEDLKKNGLPEDQLLQDWFPGYTSENY